jgi:integrase
LPPVLAKVIVVATTLTATTGIAQSASWTQIDNNPAMHRVDAYRMIQRRAAEVGMKVKIGCHAFRATGITDYLEAGGTLLRVSHPARHREAT